MFPLTIGLIMMTVLFGLMFSNQAESVGYDAASFRSSPQEAMAEGMGSNMAQFGAGVIAMLQNMRDSDPVAFTATMATVGAGPWYIRATPGVINQDGTIITSSIGGVLPGGADNFLPPSYAALGPWQVAVWPDNATDTLAVAIVFADPDATIAGGAKPLEDIKMESLAYGLQLSREMSGTSGLNDDGTLVSSTYVSPAAGAAVTTDIDTIPTAEVPDGAAVWVQCFSNVHAACN